jgi:base plate protein
MRSLSAAELLSIWEQGWDVAPAERALALLAPACPESSAGNLAALSIGERDRRLLALREATFGPQITAVTNCPNCGERLELAMQVSDICLPAASESLPAEGLRLTVEEYEVRFRLPRTEDLSVITRLADVSSARQALLHRCLLSVRRGDTEIPADCLPEHILSAVTIEMADVDPQANVQLAVSCPSCAHQWQAVFDIVSFFWLELDAWAQRLVREVHTLASTYGWREPEIVAMSPLRRQMYLELIGT